MIKVFDFFSGCGGTSQGFQDLGFEILGALDFDKDSAETYKANFPNAHFIQQDIRRVDVLDLKKLINKKDKMPLLFCGCAPCQPFSSQKKISNAQDPRINLLSEFQRFVEFWKPDFIFLENVPGLQNINKSDGVFKKFTNSLENMNYTYDTAIVQACDLGVPQIRKRFILIAANSKHKISSISDIIKKYKGPIPTTREFIKDLPPISAGESHSEVLNHTAAKLTPININRIQNTPEGGDRRDWPEHLKLGCHKNYTGHTDVYGRMKWDTPASTLTTRCTSYSNGRFGHPEQDRAISVREAARLQTFPDHFVFSGSLGSCAKQVGNAVPPLMAKRISECFLKG